MTIFEVAYCQSNFKSHLRDEAKEEEPEDAAIAAALQSSLFYSQHPSNYLYSQWLASRNSSALFGLQGNTDIFSFRFHE